MSKINKTKDLLGYINNPLSKDSVDVLYSANNIKYERCSLYSDFIQSLMMRIFDTYMGDDIMEHNDRINHFKWSWGKTVEAFKEENINFKFNRELYDYFLVFTFEVFYNLENKDDTPSVKKNILKLWSGLFSFNSVKSRSDVDTFLEVYKLFEKTL